MRESLCDGPAWLEPRGPFSRFPFLGPWDAFKRVFRDFRYGGSAEGRPARQFWRV
jgi:hypothetical protein